MTTEKTRRGGKGKKWWFKVLDDADLAEASRYALAAARYHWDGIKFYRARLDEKASWNDDGITAPGRESLNRLHHNLRAFFWQLVSAVDILLQTINRQLGLGIDERHVDWDTIARELSARKEYKQFHRKMAKGIASSWFAEVREFRNFAHRGTFLFELFTVGSENDPNDKTVGVMLVPIGGGRGTGEPVGVCKEYGSKVRQFVLAGLEELDKVPPRE